MSAEESSIIGSLSLPEAHKEQFLWHVIIWLEILLIIMVVISSGLNEWADIQSKVFNIAFVGVLIISFIIGLGLFMAYKPKVEKQGILIFLLFLTGCQIISSGTMLYQLGRSETVEFIIIILTGLAIAALGLGLMMVKLKHTSRMTGFYSLWLFGILLILFMPLHELEMLEYSSRDNLMGYLGLIITIIGSLSFSIEYRQSKNFEAWVISGDAKYIAGRYDKAVEYYEKALAIDGENALILSSKGSALLRLSMWSRALECFDRALEFEPEQALAIGGKGLALSYLKRYSEALTYHDLSIKVGREAVGWNNKGNTLFRMNAPNDEIMTCYENAIIAEPDYSNAWFNKGKSELNQGWYEKAADSFARVVELRPDFSAAWFQRGKSLSLSGSKEEALFCHDMAIQLNPANTEAWMERKNILLSSKKKKVRPIPVITITDGMPIFGPDGQERKMIPATLPEKVDRGVSGDDTGRQKAIVLASRGNYDGAINMLQKQIAKEPEDTVNYITQGMMMTRMERLDEALESFEKAIQIQPDWVGPWFCKGMVLAAMNRYDEAVVALDKAISLRYNYTDAWSVKGLIYGILRRYQEAIECFDKVTELHPDDEEAWRSKGIALNKLGRYDEAIQCFEKIVLLKPGIDGIYTFLDEEKEKLQDARDMFKVGVELAKLREYDSAIEFLEKAVKLRPNYMEALYIFGVVYGVIGDYENAMHYFERVLEIKPEHIEALYSKGNILLKEGKNSEALEFFKNVLDLKESHVDAWCDKGQAFVGLGEYDSAVECFDNALRQSGDHQRSISSRESCVKLMNLMEESGEKEEDMVLP